MFDVHNQRSFVHKMFLDAWAGDTPALKKVQAWNGHGAEFGCGWCTLRTSSGPGKSGRYYYGYAEPARYGLALQCSEAGVWSNGEGALGFCGHDALMLTDAEQRARASAMDSLARPQNYSVFGCHETSQLVRHLHYVDYNNVWLVPIAHAFLFGLVKDFWHLLLSSTKRGEIAPWYELPPKAKRLMGMRAQALVVTCDFNRPYRCIVHKRGNWVMENWLHWTETFSVLVLMPERSGVHVIHTPELRRMWELLRSAVLFFLRSPENDGEHSYLAQCEEARDNLWEYAKMAEELFQHRLCKYNLHQVCCRLLRQIVARGHCAFDAEYWLESMVRYYKTLVRGHGTTCPELYSASSMLLHQLVTRMKLEGFGGSGVEALLPNDKSKSMHGGHLDVADLYSDTQLLGSGKRVLKKDRAHVMGVVNRAMAERGLAYKDPDLVTVMLYQHAALGTEVFKSESYFRARKRVSYFTSFSGSGGREYVVKVKYFVRAGGLEPDETDMRLAVCDVYLAVSSRGMSGHLLHVPDMVNPLYEDEGLRVDKIGTKVISMLVGNKAWFAHYSNASGLIDAVVFGEDGDEINDVR